MAMEFCEHDLQALMATREYPWSAVSYDHYTGQKFNKFLIECEIKCLMKQLLEGVEHMHQLWILHRYVTHPIKIRSGKYMGKFHLADIWQ